MPTSGLWVVLVVLLPETSKVYILWNDLLDTTSMYVPSLCDTAIGPTHTYSSGDHHTTIDYFLATNDCASLLSECKTREHPVKTSDHLPFSLKLVIPCVRQPQPPPAEPRINWKKVNADGSFRTYSAAISNIIGHTLASPPCNSVEQLDDKIRQV